MEKSIIRPEAKLAESIGQEKWGDPISKKLESLKKTKGTLISIHTTIMMDKLSLRDRFEHYYPYGEVLLEVAKWLPISKWHFSLYFFVNLVFAS